jgi:hypothetical protein
MSTAAELRDRLLAKKARVFSVEVDGVLYGLREPSGYLWQQILDVASTFDKAEGAGPQNAATYRSMAKVVAWVLSTPEGDLLFPNSADGEAALLEMQGTGLIELFKALMARLQEEAASLGKQSGQTVGSSTV